VLRFVNHQHNGFFCSAVEQFQRLGQRRTGRQLWLGKVPGERTQKAEFLDANVLGQFANALFIGHQSRSNSAGNQLGRIFLFVSPEIHIHRQPAPELTFRNQVFAQKSAFSGATRRREKQARGEILNTRPHQAIGNTACQGGAAKHKAAVLGHAFILNYGKDYKL
jgi:hypothetical protein